MSMTKAFPRLKSSLVEAGVKSVPHWIPSPANSAMIIETVPRPMHELESRHSPILSRLNMGKSEINIHVHISSM